MGIDIIFRIAAVGLITAMVSTILKKSDKDEIATLVTLVGLVIVLLLVIDMLSQLFTTLQTVFGAF
ncbi:MAG TPA: stage III sporulation protein AC [Candidatus Protoclostridium stercorigallinarum]|uniref:Stage III sporulation protein AC n=1 Tax=Candidatus Protoclostridium stercorigallinarum TaxID=2838741 RepID=A0A9D1PYE0_9FIRM|nr:stage III sporulation protein AC [Candidatus Protoclostridium stercorigallinarum]